MNARLSMQPIYLHVPPEEYAEVKALGAHWDDASKSWFILAGSAPAAFARWLDEGGPEAEFNITSDEALVAQAKILCNTCGAHIEVICIFCRSGGEAGMDDGISQFTVSNIWAMDEALAQQLKRWPGYRKVTGEEYFANHCRHCGSAQEEYLLHSEPGDVFFGIAPSRSGAAQFTPLKGRVKMSGDYSLEL
jgi:hypothetical protein